MDKTRKTEIVSELNDRFSRAGATFLIDCTGVTVNKINGLRDTLREASVDFKVVRNTLAKLAVKGTDVEFLEDQFVGPVAVAFSFDDAASAAKALTEFAKDEDNFEIKSGTLGEKVLTLDEVKSLSALPSRAELLSKLVGTLNGVPTSLVGVLSALPRKLVGTLSAIEAQKS
ncbi:MAG: 50S ribosomal protein L10 [Thermodesulfobacteriota bacterium]